MDAPSRRNPKVQPASAPSIQPFSTLCTVDTLSPIPLLNTLQLLAHPLSQGAEVSFKVNTILASIRLKYCHCSSQLFCLLQPHRTVYFFNPVTAIQLFLALSLHIHPYIYSTKIFLVWLTPFQGLEIQMSRQSFVLQELLDHMSIQCSQFSRRVTK